MTKEPKTTFSSSPTSDTHYQLNWNGLLVHEHVMSRARDMEINDDMPFPLGLLSAVVESE